ncbi:SDR family NAD(P)-dependent oxidoreductase [Sciscionella marina]|uniref:SDR family NAD(P)-dependent oxidoreductase n=1 Tax=Sciscionella marina TaxID=508770 RepID=UPI0003A89C9F|nr:SDR family NAD(P)-dependent oxidoreductase [Sciscionella marina]
MIGDGSKGTVLGIMGGELSGRVAVVTGGAAGLGRAMVDRFAGEGAKVVIADLDQERVAAASDGQVVFRRVDVADSGQVRDLVEFAIAEFGRLDVFVNNAGIGGPMHASFLDDDLADFQRIVQVDLYGVMVGTQHAARWMARHGGGSIVNVASIAGVQAGCSQMVYRAVKAGVIQFSKSAAIDLGAHQVRVNCIAPGGIRTDILSSTTAHHRDGDSMAEKLREVMKEIRPLDREGAAADIAEAALYLAGDRSRYVTGTVLPVDGGMSAGYPGKPPAELGQGAGQDSGADGAVDK